MQHDAAPRPPGSRVVVSAAVLRVRPATESTAGGWLVLRHSTQAASQHQRVAIHLTPRSTCQTQCGMEKGCRVTRCGRCLMRHDTAPPFTTLRRRPSLVQQERSEGGGAMLATEYKAPMTSAAVPHAPKPKLVQDQPLTALAACRDARSSLPLGSCDLQRAGRPC